MKNSKWMLLQLFAGEGGGSAAGAPGEGGASASASGATGVDAGHQQLLELGVPEEKIRRRARRAEVKLPEGAVRSAAPTEEQTPNPQEQAAAAEPTEEKQEAKRLTWDEIMADPEYNSAMQRIIQERLRKSRGAEETLEQLRPALEIFAESYGLNPAKMDYEELSKKLVAENEYIKQKAMEWGVTTDVSRDLILLRITDKKKEELQKEENTKSIREQAMQRHYGNLLQQGEALKQKIPGFDLQQELENPVFVRLTAPGVGFSVEDAYGMVHRKEIQQATAQATAQITAQQIANTIRSGAARPDENGTASTAPSVSKFDYRKASKEQRDALKKAIYAAGARGEKLYPG